MQLRELFEQAPMPFVRSGEYNTTYLEKVKPYPGRRKALRQFMEIKRNDPNAPYGSTDKLFIPKTVFSRAVPGLRHAHIQHDLNIVYLVKGNQIFLYGFYTHGELGTGRPPKNNIQKNMAMQFARIFPQNAG